MKLGEAEITKGNFNELLADVLNRFNGIREAETLQIEEDEVVEYHTLNRAMAQHAAKFRGLGQIKSDVEKLCREAKKWYQETRTNATLELIKSEMRELYTSGELRKAYAEHKAQDDFERWNSTMAIQEMVHTERQDCFDYSNRLEKISKNLQAESYSNR